MTTANPLTTSSNILFRAGVRTRTSMSAQGFLRLARVSDRLMMSDPVTT